MRALVCLALALLLVAVHGASLQKVTNFGSNPGNLRFWIYVPDHVAAKPPVVVTVHSCSGNAPYAKSVAGSLVTMADQKGYIMVFPEARNGKDNDCFDVSSSQSLTHNGGSDAQSIVQMVQYTLNTYHADASRVYVWGFSSGAMMTNVLLGSYPDVFAAGAAMMGVPFYCFYTGTVVGWNGQCAGGSISHTPAEWGQYVHNAYKSYTGHYPRMQLFHGTNDPTLNYRNFGEEIKQWTNVHGISQTAVQTDTPRSGWTRTRYGSSDVHCKVEGISVSGAAHDLPIKQPVFSDYIIAFFGLESGGVPRDDTTPTTCTAPSAPANGQFTCTDSTCTAVCNSGYAATGTGYATCSNGNWGTLPACVPTGSGSAACGIASEGKALSVSCASGQLINAVEFASFGNPAGDCTNSKLGSCHALTSLSVMQDACVGKASCSVNAANSVFGDPCSGTVKQLAMRAHCAAVTSQCASSGENTALTLACPSSQTITGISFASYGTPTGSCGSFAKSSCHAASSLDVVQKACVGKNSCTISNPMNNAFGDPCSGTAKSLKIQALCQ